MIIDLKFDGKYVVIVGGGLESYRKTLSFLNAGSKVLVASMSFSSCIKKLYRMKKIDLLKAEIKDGRSFINGLNPKPNVLVAATNDQNLNAQLVKYAKEAGCMVYAIDNPLISDFIFPALAKIGEVRIAISTDGRSPAMAKVLRQRIEKMITQEDLLQIKLQNYVRPILKQRILNQKIRKKAIYKILKDNNIKRLLRDGKFNEAQEVAMKILEHFKINDEGHKDLSIIKNLRSLRGANDS